MPFESEYTAFLAIDPGGTTGYAAFDRNRFESGQLAGNFEAQSHALNDLFFRVSPAVVICETYTITERTAHLSQQPEALMLIGLVRYFVSCAALKLVMQRPSQAKGFATDQKLKALDWFYPTPGGHRNDSARHLLTWMATNAKFDNETLKRLAAA